jgi:hypothetical protein
MASRVHLLEPHWNPMVEAQAAARIDRLDQDKNIVIYHYVVKKSIEEVKRIVFRSPCEDPITLTSGNSIFYVAREIKSYLLNFHYLKLKTTTTLLVPRVVR